MKVIITGICGFYGHHLARYLQEKTNWEIIGLDRLDEGGSLDRLKEINFKGKMYYHDLRSPLSELLSQKIGRVNVIFHLAAMSHVDRSIIDPIGAVLDNVLGTANILEFARKYMPDKFLYFSTDEVFGPAYDNKFKEWDRFNPGSPYAATKAGGEVLALAYNNTYKVPVIVTHCMNIFGERQHPEKFIPKAINLVLHDKVVPIYADRTGKISGARSYIYADDVTRAFLMVLEKGVVGEKYNIEGSSDITNLEIAELVAQTLTKKLKTKFIAQDNVRPGNDFNYGVDGAKVRGMGFRLEKSNLKEIKRVINWYFKNSRWLN